MKNKNAQLVSQHENIKSILKSLVEDSEQNSKEYKNLNRVLKNYYIQNLNYNDKEKATFTAINFIKNHKNTLEKIQNIERRENRLFSTTSNAALITTIGAAISASLAPALVGPAAAIAAATALAGYIGKLKLDNDAKDEVKNLIKVINKIGLDSLNEENSTTNLRETTKNNSQP